MPFIRRFLFSGFLSFALLFTSVAATTAQAANSVYADDEPSELAMLGDAVVARPLLAGATLLGWAAFTITLPVSALGGNVDQAAEKLVRDRKSTRLNSSHVAISYAVFCLKKKK